MKREDFWIPLLHALSRLDGSGTRQEVFAEVENLVELTPHDREELPEDDEVRWRKHVDFVVYKFRQAGLLQSTYETERGVWALSEEGWDQVEEAKRQGIF